MWEGDVIIKMEQIICNPETLQSFVSFDDVPPSVLQGNRSSARMKLPLSENADPLSHSVLLHKIYQLACLFFWKLHTSLSRSFRSPFPTHRSRSFRLLYCFFGFGFCGRVCCGRCLRSLDVLEDKLQRALNRWEDLVEVGDERNEIEILGIDREFVPVEGVWCCSQIADDFREGWREVLQDACVEGKGGKPNESSLEFLWNGSGGDGREKGELGKEEWKNSSFVDGTDMWIEGWLERSHDVETKEVVLFGKDIPSKRVAVGDGEFSKVWSVSGDQNAQFQEDLIDLLGCCEDLGRNKRKGGLHQEGRRRRRRRREK